MAKKIIIAQFYPEVGNHNNYQENIENFKKIRYINLLIIVQRNLINYMKFKKIVISYFLFLIQSIVIH